ncbi:phospholipid scramblase 1-like [Pollicipes pollicipes]|uniref:phospholipid scramblase 1-like n=1 Tax=Pollicipes pollicipes TaxID=41117 RepID=UPI0018849D91|nr:phospholipid scramblase 1-like [Pollicipes pollicipes]XP_037090617.1 phospholipid scramblase 1-like [Pollicipes pollicipes]
MGDVVAEQPQSLTTPAEEVIPGCPKGLEHLAVAEKVIIKQELEMLEALTGYETANRYVITNEQGQQIYCAAEQSDCLARVCCRQNRAFDMRIVDNSGVEVFHLLRPFRCGGCCCSPCCLQRLEVSRGGQLLGLVTQDGRLCSTSFSVRSATGDTQLKITRACCTCRCCGERKFKIKSADGKHDVGTLGKWWGGLVREMFTDSDKFCVQFPRDMDVTVKATVVGAVFLIDFMAFEDNNA